MSTAGHEHLLETLRVVTRMMKVADNDATSLIGQRDRLILAARRAGLRPGVLARAADLHHSRIHQIVDRTAELAAPQVTPPPSLIVSSWENISPSEVLRYLETKYAGLPPVTNEEILDQLKRWGDTKAGAPPDDPPALSAWANEHWNCVVEKALWDRSAIDPVYLAALYRQSKLIAAWRVERHGFDLWTAIRAETHDRLGRLAVEAIRRNGGIATG